MESVAETPQDNNTKIEGLRKKVQGMLASVKTLESYIG
jgi:hypothetical protein